MRCAVIDLGTNTVRMCVYDLIGSGEPWNRILSEKEIVGLLGYTAHGELTDEGVAHIVEILKGFCATAGAITCDAIRCFATAGLRSIRNSSQVLEQIRIETGIKVDLISGEKEARLDFIGSFRPEGRREGLLVDMGGGSTELLRFRDEKVEHVVSLPFGSLSLYRQFVDKILPKDGELHRIQKLVSERIAQVDWLSACGAYACLIGGTARGMARLHKEIFGRQGENLQGYALPASDVPLLLEKITEEKKEGIRLIAKIIPERFHTILPGLAAYACILKRAGCKELSVSNSGVREGYLKDCLLADMHTAPH